MHKVQFIFAIHNHQPVGNFDFVAEQAYQKAYLPFISVLERHPSVRIALHYSGILYQFFEKKHPEFLDTLKRLVAEGRAEMLSGGIYEPILAVLPDEDKVGQVRALSGHINRTLRCAPKGMWLAERVWEPHLPKFLAEAGIEYVVVDDFHFKMAGLRDEELDGYYLTEEQDGLLRIFSGNERLRYLIPFHRPEETIDLLSKLRSTDRQRLVIMADDGEKFGIWPGTHRTVYEEGWLDRFFTLLEQNSEWIETTTFSGYLAKEPPRGRIFLPTASYMEMGEWTLPTRAMGEYGRALEAVKKLPESAEIRPFIKGGIWRNFLTKYPESNHMHKRMLMASRKVHDVLGRTGPAEAAKMLDHLYQSQCNDAYWHGVFGGLYLPHLRTAVYEHIITAEYLADAVRYQRQGPAGRGRGPANNAKKHSWIEIEQGDLDRDGADEVMLNTDLLNLFVDPGEGGRITEIDWKPRAFNLTNTLSRRREGYHEKLLQACRDRDPGRQDGGVKTIHDLVAVKEEGLEARLQYDRYKRGSLLDHFLGSGADLAGFMRSEYHEAGDFINGDYRLETTAGDAGAVVALERMGNVEGLAVHLRKELVAERSSGGFTVRYRITNRSREELNASFGSEFNFSLLAGDAPDRYYHIPGHTLERRHLASEGETNNVSEVRLVDEWLPLTVALVFAQPVVLWRAPVETVSQSEAGFERVYQSSMVMPIWLLSLGPGRSWETEIAVKIQ